jgi:hypothetical protein
LFLLLVAVLTLSSITARAGTITYQATDLTDTTSGEDLWQYSYLLSGFNFGLNFGFDIFFPLSQGYLFGDLENDPPEPNTDWDVVSVQPDENLPADGFLDGLALVNNLSLADPFTLQFIWRGTGTPGSQLYEIFDDTFSVIDEGKTIPAGGPTPIPEPTTLTLLLSGAALLWGGKRWQRASNRGVRL